MTCQTHARMALLGVYDNDTLSGLKVTDDMLRFNRRKFQFEFENGEALRLKLYEHLKTI